MSLRLRSERQRVEINVNLDLPNTMSKIITLTTDFGTQDGFAGAMKGRILSICPDAVIMDVTHDIQPQSILQASWSVLRSTPNFPEDSIHVVVVDPGVGSERQPLMMRSNNRWYIGPDNGIFSLIIQRYGIDAVYGIHTKTDWWHAHSSFDGLALFSPVAAYLANGLDPAKIGSPTKKIVQLLPKPPQKKGLQILGEVIMFDRFGNAITNISLDDLANLPSDRLLIKAVEQTFQLVDFYQQGVKTPSIAIINSDNQLELSVYKSSAKEKYGLKVGDKVVIEQY